jgi:hypothetical protein
LWVTDQLGERVASAGVPGGAGADFVAQERSRRRRSTAREAPIMTGYLIGIVMVATSSLVSSCAPRPELVVENTTLTHRPVGNITHIVAASVVGVIVAATADAVYVSRDDGHTFSVELGHSDAVTAVAVDSRGTVVTVRARRHLVVQRPDGRESEETLAFAAEGELVAENGWIAVALRDRIALRSLENDTWRFLSVAQKPDFETEQIRIDRDGTVWLARSHGGALDLSRARVGDDSVHRVASQSSTRAYALAPGGWLYYVYGGRLDDSPIRYYSPVDDHIDELASPVSGQHLTSAGRLVIAWSDADASTFQLRDGRVVASHSRPSRFEPRAIDARELELGVIPGRGLVRLTGAGPRVLLASGATQ